MKYLMITAVLALTSAYAVAQTKELPKKVQHDKEHQHVEQAGDHEHDESHHKDHDHKSHHPGHEEDMKKKKK